MKLSRNEWKKSVSIDEEKITVLQIAFYSHNYFDETKCLYFWLGIRRCNQRIIEERNRQNLQMLFLKFKRHFQNIFGTQKRKQIVVKWNRTKIQPINIIIDILFTCFVRLLWCAKNPPTQSIRKIFGSHLSTEKTNNTFNEKINKFKKNMANFRLK